jgi:hypothetical protein
MGDQRKTLRVLSSLVFDREAERELDDELRFHIEMRTADNLAAGMAPAQAKEDALRRFGDVEQVKDVCREIDREQRAGSLRRLLGLVTCFGLVLWASEAAKQLNVLGQLIVITVVLCRLWMYVQARRPGEWKAKSEPIWTTSAEQSSPDEQAYPSLVEDRKRPPIIPPFRRKQNCELSLVVALLILSLLTASLAIAGFAMHSQFTSPNRPAGIKHQRSFK